MPIYPNLFLSNNAFILEYVTQIFFFLNIYQRFSWYVHPIYLFISGCPTVATIPLVLYKVSRTSYKPPTNLQQTSNKPATNLQQTSNEPPIIFSTRCSLSSTLQNTLPWTLKHLFIYKHSGCPTIVDTVALVLYIASRTSYKLPTNLQQKSNKLPTNLKKIVKLSYHFRFLQPFS